MSLFCCIELEFISRHILYVAKFLAQYSFVDRYFHKNISNELIFENRR